MRLFFLFLAVLIGGNALAQAYPSKPIRFIVSFPPGGSADLMVRAIAPRMGDQLGQPVVVENRAGAGGMIGVDAVAKAPADGYTIGLAAEARSRRTFISIRRCPTSRRRTWRRSRCWR